MAELNTQYAGQVREALRASPAGLTMSEIQAQAKLSERLARIGVGILAGLGEITEGRRHVPHRRGAMPIVYSLK